MSSRADLQRMLFNLSGLVDLGQEVVSGRGFADRMKTALYAIMGMFSIPEAALFVHDPAGHDLVYLTGRGRSELSGVRLSLAEEDRVDLPQNEPADVPSKRIAGLLRRNGEVFGGLRADVLVPLFARQELIGMMVLGPRLSGGRLLRTERDVLRVAAHQLAAAMQNARLFARCAEQADENLRLYENMRRIYHDTISAFATAIDAKDRYTKNHSFRVAGYAASMARELQWSDGAVEAIYVAGLLHDIGKLSLDADLINKGETLTPQEQEKIRRHAEISFDIVQKIRLPWGETSQYIRHHHERPDGRGYPDCLESRDLSDGAKILAVADAYDAMTTDRPYRPRLTQDEAIREIRRCEGAQFDGRISSVLFRLIESGRAARPLHPSGGKYATGGTPLLSVELPRRADA